MRRASRLRRLDDDSQAPELPAPTFRRSSQRKDNLSTSPLPTASSAPASPYKAGPRADLEARAYVDDMLLRYHHLRGALHGNGLRPKAAAG